MQRTAPPFRADHVGSLLRPKELLEARRRHAQGQISAPELRAIEDEAIRKVVRAQEAIGLQGITDGEFRRTSFHLDFFYQLGGVRKTAEDTKVMFHNTDGDVEFATAGVQVTGKVTLERTIFGEDFAFLKSITRATPKLTIPAASLMHLRGGRNLIDPAIYPDVEAFWSDFSEAYAREIEALGRLGCTYLQLDDTIFAAYGDPSRRAAVLAAGGDPETQHLTYIKVNNDALRYRPPGMTICVHTCRGNFRSAWTASGGYDFIAEALFNELDVDGFFLEYDDARSGGFEPLRFMPKGKFAVLGLVTTKHGTIESKDDLKRRIDAAARFIPLEQLCLSPQCGFASTVEGNALSEAEQLAKLELVATTAREVWG